MPSQTFIITRAPEEKPLTTDELRRLIHLSRTTSEWQVLERHYPTDKEIEDYGTKWNQRMDELGAKRGTIDDLKNI